MRREKKKCPSNVGPFQLLFYGHGDYFQVGNVTYIFFIDAKKQENNSSLIRIVILHCFSAIAKPLCFLRKANGFLSKLPLWRCSATETAGKRRHVSRVPVGWHFGDNRAKRGGGNWELRQSAQLSLSPERAPMRKCHRNGRTLQRANDKTIGDIWGAAILQ